jgi:glyoxylase-like metal-dependent hydrolase (beta-lactamase superfamily II)
MTLAGTNTYVVGRDPAYVIDPGPADEAHIAALLTALDERGGAAGVLLTHSHADHSEAAARLGAPLLWGMVAETAEEGRDAGASGEPHRPPDRIGPFEPIATPGHTRDHVAFALGEACFCGDLILGEGSSIVLPGGGGLRAYLDSLARLRARGFALLCPGHGPWITDPAAALERYRDHRLERERALVAALDRGERSRRALLDQVWSDVPEPLRPAAALAMEVHLEKLAEEGRLEGETLP